MNKTLKDILHSATGLNTTPALSVDSIVSPITSIGGKLRIAEQLDGMVL